MAVGGLVPSFAPLPDSRPILSLVVGSNRAITLGLPTPRLFCDREAIQAGKMSDDDFAFSDDGYSDGSVDDGSFEEEKPVRVLWLT